MSKENELTTEQLRAAIKDKVDQNGIAIITVTDGYIIATSPPVAEALFKQVEGQPDVEFALVFLRDPNIPLSTEEATTFDIMNPKVKA